MSSTFSSFNKLTSSYLIHHHPSLIHQAHQPTPSLLEEFEHFKSHAFCQDSDCYTLFKGHALYNDPVARQVLETLMAGS